MLASSHAGASSYIKQPFDIQKRRLIWVFLCVRKNQSQLNCTSGPDNTITWNLIWIQNSRIFASSCIFFNIICSSTNQFYLAHERTRRNHHPSQESRKRSLIIKSIANTAGNTTSTTISRSLNARRSTLPPRPLEYAEFKKALWWYTQRIPLRVPEGRGGSGSSGRWCWARSRWGRSLHQFPHTPMENSVRNSKAELEEAKKTEDRGRKRTTLDVVHKDGLQGLHLHLLLLLVVFHATHRKQTYTHKDAMSSSAMQQEGYRTRWRRESGVSGFGFVPAMIDAYNSIPLLPESPIIQTERGEDETPAAEAARRRDDGCGCVLRRKRRAMG